MSTTVCEVPWVPENNSGLSPEKGAGLGWVIPKEQAVSDFIPGLISEARTPQSVIRGSPAPAFPGMLVKIQIPGLQPQHCRIRQLSVELKESPPQKKAVGPPPFSFVSFGRGHQLYFVYFVTESKVP